jgi:hypothetical protein
MFALQDLQFNLLTSPFTCSSSSHGQSTNTEQLYRRLLLLYPPALGHLLVPRNESLRYIMHTATSSERIDRPTRRRHKEHSTKGSRSRNRQPTAFWRNQGTVGRCHCSMVCAEVCCLETRDACGQEDIVRDLWLTPAQKLYGY